MSRNFRFCRCHSVRELRADCRRQTNTGTPDTGLVTHGQGNQTAVQSLRRSLALAEAVLACCLWLQTAVVAVGSVGVGERDGVGLWERCGCAGGGVGERETLE
ncbi:Hypothetical predicted protein [Olea europaea subsp. europaea]|uniref:Uncharacterized protein n=1 Tax=Olea europaea subsp. europaea TaxID=158383 RepID=A0A8S0Q377_OLEEU|nr:Hypothetical predicted protein [Olea europaea subsp. europaea]